MKSIEYIFSFFYFNIIIIYYYIVLETNMEKMMNRTSHNDLNINDSIQSIEPKWCVPGYLYNAI